MDSERFQKAWQAQLEAQAKRARERRERARERDQEDTPSGIGDAVARHYDEKDEQ